MGLPAVGLWTEVLGIKNVFEVLICVERAVWEQSCLLSVLLALLFGLLGLVWLLGW